MSLPRFGLNLALAAVLALLLGLVYMRFGRTLSNRRLLARNFLLLTVTTTLVISIVKSSLALSLGLVGALSIVRFRAAIKEPEELTYLFLAIAIGLGLGAGQALITAAAFLGIVIIIVLQHLFRPRVDAANLHLAITSPAAANLGVTRLQELFKQHGIAASLERLDETPESLEASFRVAVPEPARLEQLSRDLRGISAEARLSVVADRGFAD
jgi:uncharacterized membrane protein YhiD involved in acid resistance